MKKIVIGIVVVLIVLTISSCAAGPNEMVNTPDADGDVAGFWQGVWNGFSAPFTFIISLFSESIHVYEVHNNGGWYNFGFLFGASIIFGGTGRGAKRRR